MRRRDLLGILASGPFLAGLSRRTSAGPAANETIPAAVGTRVRPGDPAWPSTARWDELRRQTSGRLIEVESPLRVCQTAPNGEACRGVFRDLKNPYYIGDDVALTQTTGWVDA